MAAGLGFKTFTTGEVLTAADTNGYLMQGVLVFASAAARDAAITSPQEGQCCYLKDTDAVLTYSGSAWVGFDDSNAIQNSIVDAKGDLVAASGADTPARLAVGANGETLVADSATATGLRYQVSQAAGKNALINGGFDIWQRGTTSGSAGYQTADRWYENASNTTTFAQETTTVPTGSKFAFKMTAGATASMYIIQAIETSNSLQYVSQNVTAQAMVQASVSTGMTISVQYSTSVDNPASGSWTAISPTTGGTATAVSGSFTKLSGVFAVPSTAKSLMVQITTTSTVASAVIVYVGQAMLELGSVASAFVRNGATIQGELAACQRYYQKSYDTGTNPGTSGAAGPIYGSQVASTTSTGQLVLTANFQTTMRNTPTITVYDLNGNSGFCNRETVGLGGDASQSANVTQQGSKSFVLYGTGTNRAGLACHYTASAEL
jgi:hypothetical protein